MQKIRSGIGYDLHRLEKGDGLFLGGVKVSEQYRFVAHSDGDLLIHALIDSLLGAVGEKDIGEYFPDTDERYRGISSLKLLAAVGEMIAARGLRIGNIDAVVVLQQPKLSPRAGQMAENLARTLGIGRERVNVKATTNEGLDAVGHGEAIAAWAVAGLEEEKV